VIARSSTSVADFLKRSLASGALGVPDLEVKARAVGLLREHQQIQHAKAFKKAKKELGIQSIRNGFESGGKWAWSMPLQGAQIAIVTIANSNLDAKDQPCVRDLKPPYRAPAESASGGIVQQWIDGVERLDYVRSPPAVPAIRWHLFLGDCHSFLSSFENWAERAAVLGWNALALFGCHRSRPLEHLGSAGLLWAINGGNLVELYRDWAVIERRRDKSRQVYHRRRQDEARVTLPCIWRSARPRGFVGRTTDLVTVHCASSRAQTALFNARFGLTQSFETLLSVKCLGMGRCGGQSPCVRRLVRLQLSFSFPPRL
jgi:hypothetical protein